MRSSKFFRSTLIVLGLWLLIYTIFIAQSISIPFLLVGSVLSAWGFINYFWKMPPKPSKSEEEEDSEEDFSEMTAGDWFWDIVNTWGPAILVVLFIRSAIAEPFRIPSGSMVPTLEIGDHILVTKFSYGLRIPLTRIPLGSLSLPERGDVIVFVKPGTDEAGKSKKLSYWMDLPFPPFATTDYIKRVVALPGEKVKIEGGVVYIDGKEQTQKRFDKQDFIDDKCRPNKTRLFEEDLKGYSHSILKSTGSHISSRSSDYPEQVVPEGEFFVMGDNRDHSADSRSWGFVPIRNVKGKARFIWLSYDQCTPGLPLLGAIRGDRFGSLIE